MADKGLGKKHEKSNLLDSESRDILRTALNDLNERGVFYAEKRFTGHLDLTITWKDGQITYVERTDTRGYKRIGERSGRK